MLKELYTPKMSLKEVVIELALILQSTTKDKDYQKRIDQLIAEIKKWGTPKLS